MFVLGYRYDGAKRTTFGSNFWNNEEQARNSLSRRDVPTSRRRVNNTEVNNSATSRRQLENLHLIIKCQTARKLGHREAYDQRHGIPEQSSTVFEEVHGIFVSFFVFLTFWDIRTMFSVLNDFIFSFIMF